MKAITLWGPYGSLVAHQFKPIETRTHDRFKTLRGERVAVHQGLSCAPLARVIRMAEFVGASQAATWLRNHPSGWPRGCVVATAFVASVGWLDGTIEDNIAACVPTDGLFGLRLDHIRIYEEPIRVRGHQGVWEWDGHEPYEDNSEHMLTEQGAQDGEA